MASTGYDVHASPPARRALGYRWEDNRWLREPDMADGAFGAMGGVQTSVADYARWVRFILDAWPPRDGADDEPVSRATVREIVEGSNHVEGAERSPRVDAMPCRTANAYGMGWRVIDDCELGRVLMHSGGYPGYGSNVVLLPDHGIAVFAFTNRTYSGPSTVVMKAALAIHRAGDAPLRKPVTSERVAAAYAAIRSVWEAGDVSAAQPALAMNFLLDRGAGHRNAEIARLKAEVGECVPTPLAAPLSQLEGSFRWNCAHGRIEGHFVLAPTAEAQIQSLDFTIPRP